MDDDIVWSAWKHVGVHKRTGNTVAGIVEHSDENLHAEAAAWLFKTYKNELIAAGEINEDYLDSLQKDIYLAAETVFDHECKIISKLFEKGKIEGITEIQLQHFAQSRINLCLRNLGYNNLYKVDYNPIAEWFYTGINGYLMQDFFSSQGNQYQRDWSGKGFIFKGVQG